MVIQKAIDNLKDKPKDDRKAVAGGVAIVVVVVLFLGWAFIFFKNIQRGAQLQQLGGGAQDEFNFSSVKQAQEELMQGFSDFDELRNVREESAQGSQPAAVQEDYQMSETDQFGQPSTSD